LHVLCFEPDGTPREYSHTTIANDIAPNGTAAFQADLFFYGGCDLFLIAGSALVD